mmetsp:Transcript_1942/g.2902  ORF Transcript_1942/g.2902 Transcript_1942/m.2902 type:complete len:171 (-) Transcript_1942:101-613(-)
MPRTNDLLNAKEISKRYNLSISTSTTILFDYLDYRRLYLAAKKEKLPYPIPYARNIIFCTQTNQTRPPVSWTILDDLQRFESGCYTVDERSKIHPIFLDSCPYGDDSLHVFVCMHQYYRKLAAKVNVRWDSLDTISSFYEMFDRNARLTCSQQQELREYYNNYLSNNYLS